MNATDTKKPCTHVNELLLRIYNLSPGIATYLDDFWTDGTQYQMVFKALPAEAVRIIKDQCSDCEILAFARNGHQMLGVKGKCPDTAAGEGASYAKELASGSFSG